MDEITTLSKLGQKRSKKKTQLVRLGEREIETLGLSQGFWSDLYHRSMAVSWPVFFGSAAALFVALNTVFGFRQVVGLRKSLGLYAFLYATLHFLTFVGLDYGFDPSLLKEAIFKKRYALVGFAAFLALLPLAITSTRGWMRRLGKNWKSLHRLIYLAALLVIIHFVWLVKSDIREPLAYGAVVVLLLVLRLKTVRRALVDLRERFASRRRGYDRVAVPEDRY